MRQNIESECGGQLPVCFGKQVPTNLKTQTILLEQPKALGYDSQVSHNLSTSPTL
jgi:hypothetical protein